MHLYILSNLYLMYMFGMKLHKQHIRYYLRRTSHPNIFSNHLDLYKFRSLLNSLYKVLFFHHRIRNQDKYLHIHQKDLLLLLLLLFLVLLLLLIQQELGYVFNLQVG